MSGKRKPAAESHPMNNGNLRVEYRRTDSLIPYPRNARKHPKAQVAQIAGSIAEFGFLVPVLVDGAGGIIAGHGRVLAAQRLGMESVPCIQATHLTEAQKRAFVLADNKLTENAGWDDELLRLEMTDLNLAGFDLKLTGFDEGDLSRLLTPLDSGEDNPAPSRGHYHWQHEPCWYAVRKGASARWAGDRSQGTVWDIPSVGSGGSGEGATPHSTQKPLECMARPIRNHGAPGDFIYDPFLGSGTTLIACERLGRICLGMEIAPEYVDVAIRRWHLETGKPAVREDGGLVYDHAGWHKP